MGGKAVKSVMAKTLAMLATSYRCPIRPTSSGPMKGLPISEGLRAGDQSLAFSGASVPLAILKTTAPNATCLGSEGEVTFYP